MNANSQTARPPWNKGQLIGQTAPLEPKEIRAIRIHLQMAQTTRDLALFDYSALIERPRSGGRSRNRPGERSVFGVAREEHPSECH